MPVSAEKIIILDATASTNNYAMALISKGEARHGLAVFAIDQFEGKGRQQKVWRSAPGENIILSVVTEMRWAFLSSQFQISVAAALSVAELLMNYCDDKVFVKWPNDIFIGDRKAAGILIENVIHGTLWQWAVTGMGVNINQTNFPPDLKATSLTLNKGKKFDVLKLSVELRDLFLNRIEQWRLGKNNWLDDYNQMLFGKGKKVRLKKGNIAFDTEIKSVNSGGQLITTDTIEREWNFGEVSIERVYDPLN